MAWFWRSGGPKLGPDAYPLDPVEQERYRLWRHDHIALRFYDIDPVFRRIEEEDCAAGRRRRVHPVDRLEPTLHNLVEELRSYGRVETREAKGLWLCTTDLSALGQVAVGRGPTEEIACLWCYLETVSLVRNQIWYAAHRVREGQDLVPEDWSA